MRSRLVVHQAADTVAWLLGRMNADGSDYVGPFNIEEFRFRAERIVRELDRDGLLRSSDDIGSSIATARAVATTTRGVDMPEKDAAYEAAKTNWIAQHGSRRLRLAHERGYRIDTLYRDERLTRELADCKALRRPKVKDIVNPSEEALDLEDDFHGRGFPDARLVFVTDSDDSDHGEAVEVPGVFGKFTVYAMVNDDE